MHTHVFIQDGMYHTRLCLYSQSWSSFTHPGWMEGWVGLGTTTVSKHSARDRYVANIALVRCLHRHWATGAQRQASNFWPIEPQATTHVSVMLNMTERFVSDSWASCDMMADVWSGAFVLGEMLWGAIVAGGDCPVGYPNKARTSHKLQNLL